jgi:hypothetical protein
MNRREFLLLRAGQPAVLSCELLFMRYLDAQLTGNTEQLFDHLAADLRNVKVVQLTDTSWRASAEFDRHLARVLDAFTASGNRLDA